MSRSQGLQHFIEQKAAGPAFAIAAASVMLRGAEWWSGGAFNVGALLGPGGLAAFNAGTGVGIAVGSELLASIFGRQRKRQKAEAREARGRAGMRRAERDALVAQYEADARVAGIYMWLGIAASAAAGFWFLQSSTRAEGPIAIVSELLITGMLVAVVSGLGIHYEPRQDDAGEMATEHARGLRSRIVEAAGARIARGEHTVQDVRILARQLPKREQERFMAALAPEATADPLWNVNDLADWLGMDTASARRQLQRRLAKLSERGANVVRDDRGRYVLPRSEAFREFAEDFIRLNRTGAEHRTLTSVPSASNPRQIQPAEALASA